MSIIREHKKNQTQNDLKIPLAFTHRSPPENQENMFKDSQKKRKITITGSTQRKFRKALFTSEKKDQRKHEK